MWRPKDWNNPMNPKSGVFPSEEALNCAHREFKAYEDGADAILEALKKEGAYGKKFDGSLPYHAQQPVKGWAVFIPDERQPE